jgi:hypothetical protein
MLWFQFFSAEEDQTLREWEEAVVAACFCCHSRTSTDKAKTLPAALGWVAQYFDPLSPAAGRARRHMDFQSSESGTCQTAEKGDSSGAEASSGELNHAEDCEGACASTSRMRMEGTTVDTIGTSNFSGDECASGTSDAESSDTESDDWVLGADEAQRLKTTCGRHKYASSVLGCS